MDFHIGVILTCLLALANVLDVNGDCTCINHMSQYGFGNCKRYSWALRGKMCYVKSTSTCSDKLLSKTENGLYKSAEACNQLPSGCNCVNHLSPYGFGNCERYSWALRGKMCYVESTSTCPDKLPSQTENGLYKSAMACYVPSGKQCKIRKNVATLSNSEKDRLKSSLKNAIESKEPWRNFTDNSNFHGEPATICTDKTTGQYKWCCPHGDLDFLPWHRLYMVNTEQMLNEALPYWDWTDSGDVPDLWNGISAPFKKPFQSIFGSSSAACMGDDVTQSRRGSFTVQTRMSELASLTKVALQKANYEDFSNQIEEAHNLFHVSMGCDMARAESAAYDPIFFLHHTYVDYQFAYWQELYKLRNKGEPFTAEQMTSSENIMEPFDFNNANYNPYEITRKNSRARNVIDYKTNLCYEYDNLLFQGQTPQQFHLTTIPTSNTRTRNGPSTSNRRVFVGVALPKSAPSSLVDFEICNKHKKCIKGGSLATFGFGSKHGANNGNNIFNNYNMIEYEVTDAVQENASFDTSAAARITSTDDLGILSGLEPIMIWRYDGGVEGGVVYLSPGSNRKDYGKLLNKYDDVKEN